MGSKYHAGVLVTGASGYIATSIVNDLLKKGFSVRGTVRSLKNPGKVNPLKSLADGKPGKLELVEADLLKPETWRSAVSGCSHVLHTASPFPFEQPADADVVIRPAVDGTLNVLKACKEAGCVERVVVTSSIASVGIRHTPEKPLNENDWTDPNNGGIEGEPYVLSKLMAEKAAFDFVKSLPEKERFELCTVLPGYVVGPTLTDQPATSLDTIKRIMVGGDLLVPDVNLTFVDIRDVVDAHLVCMTSPKAAGQRYLVVDKVQAYAAVCKLLNDEFSSQGYSSSSRLAPRFLIRLMSLFDKAARTMNLLWGIVCEYDNTKLKEELGIQPRDCRKAIIDMAYSLIDNGYIEKRDNYRGRIVVI
ncbi:Tetraketide alpha-pyrone reductase 1 [Holothuria leucospilota]|uniref:Tetraketide alpha-pyrone reductase 1 n=1 Tax=Holothuria leucospilota TaxID=206669 RepID=A0A9Q1BQD9_HOLLE|nr:Tetraketide alpha-pyrone reductase 1 [Holothuria leucospilota]